MNRLIRFVLLVQLPGLFDILQLLEVLLLLLAQDVKELLTILEMTLPFSVHLLPC